LSGSILRAESYSRFGVLLAAIAVVILLLHVVSQLTFGRIQGDGIDYIWGALGMINTKDAFFRAVFLGDHSIGLTWLDPRGPLFEVILAISFVIFGDSFNAAALVPQFLGITATFLIFLVARMMYGKKVALAALILALTNLELMNLSAQILRETLLSTLFLLLIYATLRYEGTRRSLLVGVVLGLLYWTREDFVVLLVPTLLYVLWNNKRKMVNSMALLGSTAIVASPWAYYSLVALHTLTPSLATHERIQGVHLGATLGLLPMLAGGIFMELWLLPTSLTIFATIFLLIGIFGKIGRRELFMLSLSAMMLVVDAPAVYIVVPWPALVSNPWSWGPLPWSWIDANRYTFPFVIPLLVFCAKGVIQVGDSIRDTGAFVSSINVGRIRFIDRHVVAGLLLVALTLFSVGYVVMLSDFKFETAYPYYNAAQWMNKNGVQGAIISFHPDVLREYYTRGEIYAMPDPPTSANILTLARETHARYMLVDYSMSTLGWEVIWMYWVSENPQLLMQIKNCFYECQLVYVAGDYSTWALFIVQPS